jgi:hypothetical protein
LTLFVSATVLGWQNDVGEDGEFAYGSDFALAVPLAAFWVRESAVFPRPRGVLRSHALPHLVGWPDRPFAATLQEEIAVGND